MAVEQRDRRVWSPEGPDQGKEIDVNTAAKTIAAVYYRDTAKLDREALRHANGVLKFLEKSLKSGQQLDLASEILEEIDKAVRNYRNELIAQNRSANFSVNKEEINLEDLDKFHDQVFRVAQELRYYEGADDLNRVFKNLHLNLNILMGKEFESAAAYRVILGNLFQKLIGDGKLLLYRIAALPEVAKMSAQRRWQNTKARGRAAKDKTKIKLESAKVKAKAKLKEGWQSAKAKLPNFKLAEQSKVRKFFNTAKQKGKGLVARVLRGRSKEGSNKGRFKGILTGTLKILSLPLVGVAGLYAKAKQMNAQRRARNEAVIHQTMLLKDISEQLAQITELLQGNTRTSDNQLIGVLRRMATSQRALLEGQLEIARVLGETGSGLTTLPGPSNKDFGGPWSQDKEDQPRDSRTDDGRAIVQ